MVLEFAETAYQMLVSLPALEVTRQRAINGLPALRV